MSGGRQQSFLAEYTNGTTILFWLCHVAAVALLWRVGWSWRGLAVTGLVYACGMFFVTAGYHRYFSHRSFKTSRWFQFVLAFGAQITIQKSVLWWAARHRHHHKMSDHPEDVHSTRHHGFWWSHMGWFLSRQYKATDFDSIRDMAKYPELRMLHGHPMDYMPGVLYAALMYVIGGTWLLAWGAMIPLVLVWHGTFTINSLSHVFGWQRYDTNDDSKNNPILALVTLGEGWHNNHHHYQRSCRQGFFWWEFDITYYVLRLLSVVGLVWDVTSPPKHVIEGRTRGEARPASSAAT